MKNLVRHADFFGHRLFCTGATHPATLKEVGYYCFPMLWFSIANQGGIFSAGICKVLRV